MSIEAIAAIVASFFGIVFYIGHLISKNKDMQRENALLKTEKEVSDGVYKFNESKEKGNALEERYQKARQEFIDLMRNNSGNGE